MLELALKRDRTQIGCVIQDVMGKFPPAEFGDEFRGGLALAGIGIGIVVGGMPDLIGADFTKAQMRGKFRRYPAVRAVAQIGIIGKTIVNKVKQLVFRALFAGVKRSSRPSAQFTGFGDRSKSVMLICPSTSPLNNARLSGADFGSRGAGSF